MTDSQQQHTIQVDGEPFERINAELARGMIEQHEVLVIDVREPREWEQGHIAGSVHIPLNQFFLDPSKHVQHDGVLFVCSVGVRSAIACEMAAAIGRERLYNLEAGLTGWSAKGYPLER